MKLNHKQVFILIVLSSLFLFCFNSCGMRAEQKSLTAQFTIVDALISQNQFKEANKELKSIQKKAYDSWSYLGIFRRYRKMGVDKAAEKLLKTAIKKNPANQELIAVYSEFLLQANRIDEAVEVSKKLKGGKFGSIYSESILKQAAISSAKDENPYIYFNQEKFYDIYYDAYAGSKNPIWLRNCAIYNLTQGQFGVACRIAPDFFADADDSYFWALVQYDGGKFYESITALDASKRFLNDYVNKNLFKTSYVKISALKSDSYMALSQMENAEKARKEIINQLDNIQIRKNDEALIPIIYTNSAIWAKNQGNLETCADLLFYVVTNFQSYVPALIQYADFAYESNQERKEDDEIKALRNVGLSTLEMEKYDSRRKIPISDALYRIDLALKTEKNPYLEIKKIDLNYKQQKNLTEKEKNRNLWVLLENNYDDNPEFKTLLLEYAINYLISVKNYEDAWTLYSDYLYHNITFNEKENFWDTFINHMRYLELPVVEIAGWFATYNKKVDAAIRIYEYCVYESSGFLEDKLISPYVSASACMNLADLYYSTGRKDKAIELYGKIAGRESNNALRSEIYYRIANIYYDTGDIKSALRSAEYSKDLYPDNVKASLLKDKCELK